MYFYLVFYSFPTVFWWDNFDRKIDRLRGGGTINTTPGMALQKIAESSRTEEFTINIEKSKRRSFRFRESTPEFILLILKLTQNNSEPRITQIQRKVIKKPTIFCC